MKVIVGFLHRADSLAPQFRRSLTRLMVRDAHTRRRIVDELDQESSANICAGRCSIVEAFLGHPSKADWLWMLDSDMVFDVDILDRLLVSADPDEKPIMGGLCFGMRPVKGHPSRVEAFPTIYKPSEDGAMVPWFDYPRGEVVHVFSTGAACLLIHRRVFDDKRWRADGHPFPWFREDVMNGRAASEDQFFCVKAGALGYPIHVDTHARCGHVKPVVIDESFYDEHR